MIDSRLFFLAESVIEAWCNRGVCMTHRKMGSIGNGLFGVVPELTDCSMLGISVTQFS